MTVVLLELPQYNSCINTGASIHWLGFYARAVLMCRFKPSLSSTLHWRVSACGGYYLPPALPGPRENDCILTEDPFKTPYLQSNIQQTKIEIVTRILPTFQCCAISNFNSKALGRPSRQLRIILSSGCLLDWRIPRTTKEPAQWFEAVPPGGKGLASGVFGGQRPFRNWEAADL